MGFVNRISVYFQDMQLEEHDYCSVKEWKHTFILIRLVQSKSGIFKDL